MHLYQSVFFVCITKSGKWCFCPFWNRTNSCVAAKGFASNLNAPKGSIPIDRLKKHCSRRWLTQWCWRSCRRATWKRRTRQHDTQHFDCRRKTSVSTTLKLCRTSWADAVTQEPTWDKPTGRFHPYNAITSNSELTTVTMIIIKKTYISP